HRGARQTYGCLAHELNADCRRWADRQRRRISSSRTKTDNRRILHASRLAWRPIANVEYVSFWIQDGQETETIGSAGYAYRHVAINEQRSARARGHADVAEIEKVTPFFEHLEPVVVRRVRRSTSRCLGEIAL